MAEKPSEELKFIVSNKDYTPLAQQAAQWELERRESYGNIDEIPPTPVSGEGLYRDVIADLRLSLSKNNKSQEPKKRVDFDIPVEKVRRIVMKAAEKLEWKCSDDGSEVIYIGRVNEQGIRKQSYLLGLVEQQSLMAYKPDSGSRKEEKEAYLWILLFLHVFEEIKMAENL